jgi:hypothetical protein
VKAQFSKIDKVWFIQDGVKITLDKKTFPQFENTAVIKESTAIYRLYLQRKAAPALAKYMQQLPN